MSKFKEVATKASRAAEAQVTLTKLCDNTSLIEGAAEDFVDDDEEEEENASEVVQLGYVDEEKNELFRELDWSYWDGGRVGGQPVWLDPAHPPMTDQVTCKSCSEPLVFLLQIYCPLDDVPFAFHRALYVFCCKKSSCVKNGNSIVCLRSQLAKMNSLYAETPSSATPHAKNSEVYCSLCTVCGCRGPMRCKACKKAAYCSKLHQKLDWSRHKRVCNIENSVDSLRKEGGKEWLFPEYGLCVEQEEFDDADIDESTNIWEDALTPGGKDEEDDAKLTQADYEKALGSESSDPIYIRFLTRVKRGGTDQVLRYCRWPKNGRGALPISSAASSDHLEPSPCERCGAPRSFECQIMPQLLHFLRIENRTKIAPSAEAARLLQQDLPSEEQVFQNALNEDIDWGTVDIYTCTASCQLGDESNAVEELVRIQAPPSAERLRLA